MFRRRRWTRFLGMLDVEPLVALAAARAIRIAEWQPHLVRKIGAQEVCKICAVGMKVDRHIVFAETQIIEEKITRSIAQYFVPGFPRRLRVKRCIEKFRDPCREQIFCCAVPVVTNLPDAATRSPRRRRLLRAHDNIARDGPALGARGFARQCRVPCPGGRRGDFGNPEIGWPAISLIRFGGDAAIRGDQRKFAV